jgi:hypothetical protein
LTSRALGVFALKVGFAALGINLIVAAVYWRGSRRKTGPTI